MQLLVQKPFEMSSFKIRHLRVEDGGKKQQADMGVFHHEHKQQSWFFIFPGVKIKTCLQRQGDAVRGQLQATLLITKHRLICGNGDTAISPQRDIFILPDIMFYYCSMPPRETDGCMWDEDEQIWGEVDWSQCFTPEFELCRRFVDCFSFYLICISLTSVYFLLWTVLSVVFIASLHCLWSSLNYLCSEQSLSLPWFISLVHIG